MRLYILSLEARGLPARALLTALLSAVVDMSNSSAAARKEVLRAMTTIASRSFKPGRYIVQFFKMSRELRVNLPDDPVSTKRERPSFQWALEGPARRGKSNGTGIVHLFRRNCVVISANYDGKIPQPLKVILRHASMVSWMEQKGQ